MSSGSSLRRTACPMTFSVATTPIAPSGPCAGHGPGGVEDGPHDVLVAGAPAEVPLQCQAEVVLRGRRVLPQVARRGHDHARRAIAALQAVMAIERLLQWMQLAVGCHALDRRDLA